MQNVIASQMTYAYILIYITKPKILAQNTNNTPEVSVYDIKMTSPKVTRVEIGGFPKAKIF